MIRLMPDVSPAMTGRIARSAPGILGCHIGVCFATIAVSFVITAVCGGFRFSITSGKATNGASYGSSSISAVKT
jgi:uncharacterized membrane protein